jgi:putative transposase
VTAVFAPFNVVDDFNREALAIEIDLSLAAPRVIRVLERIVAWRNHPNKLRMDNGPEYIGQALRDWAIVQQIACVTFCSTGQPHTKGYY